MFPGGRAVLEPCLAIYQLLTNSTVKQRLHHFCDVIKLHFRCNDFCRVYIIITTLSVYKPTLMCNRATDNFKYFNYITTFNFNYITTINYTILKLVEMTKYVLFK